MKTLSSALLPILVIALGVVVALGLVITKEQVESVTPPPAVKPVEVHDVEFGPVELTVQSTGVVEPRTETTLTAEVTGRIVEVAPVFETGAFVEKGQLLLRVDPSTYEAAVATAEADVARAEAALTREQAEADLAIREWEQFGEGEASALARREPQLAEARATVRSVKARWTRAKIDLDRTEVRAPFKGRIRSRSVDAGQYLTAGSPVAVVFATDFAEVRIGITPDQLRFIDLPLGEPITNHEHAPKAILRARFAGRTVEWTGFVNRTEGEMDRDTRMIHAVIRVPDPYGREVTNGDHPHPPLLIGTFVGVEVTGRQLEHAAVVDRRGLIPSSNPASSEWVALVVAAEEHLELRPVEVFQITDSHATVTDGLSEGERLCVTPLAVIVDGMKVRVLGEEEESSPSTLEEDAPNTELPADSKAKG